MQEAEIVFETRSIDYWRGVLELIYGKDHGLGVAVCGVDPKESIEILGTLPVELRRGLRQAVLCYVPLPRHSKREPRGKFTWTPRRDGSGRSYFIPNMGVLLHLLAERRLVLNRGAV